MRLDPALGRQLLRAGLAERAVLACFEVAAVAHVPRGRSYEGALPPAAIAPWLLCAGGEVDAGAARRVLGGAFARLVEVGFLDVEGGRARATVAILPAGGAGALAVSDRFDDFRAGAVPPPDDSSHHLVSALPRRRVRRWLDVGTGAGWAPLAAAGRADEVIATDVNPRAIDRADEGALLSGVTFETRVADLAEGVEGRFDLVTFNAPIPGPGDPILARFWAAAPGLVAEGGEVIVHSVLEGEHPAGALGGELVVARYTPPGVRAFGVTVWRPGGSGRRLVEITLTSSLPHVPRAVLEP